MILKSLAILKINIFSNIFPYFHRYLMLLLMNSKECKQKTKKNFITGSKNTITGLPIPYSVNRDYV